MLGLIAGEQGRLEDALKELTRAVQQDDKHLSSDVWREIGAVHLSAGRLPEAEAGASMIRRSGICMARRWRNWGVRRRRGSSINKRG
jgi:hypothetical protein